LLLDDDGRREVDADRHERWEASPTPTRGHMANRAAARRLPKPNKQFREPSWISETYFE
jgi:hypothetical protein